MANKPTVSPALLVKEIEDNSQRLNQLATELSTQISAFEDWLNQLPGKVETELFFAVQSEGFDVPRISLADMIIGDRQARTVSAVGPAREFGIRFSRCGKRWALLCRPVRPASDLEVFGWQSLKDASVESKSIAVQHLPEFLKRISEAQVQHISQIEQAHQEFAKFADSIGIKSLKEGK